MVGHQGLCREFLQVWIEQLLQIGDTSLIWLSLLFMCIVIGKEWLRLSEDPEILTEAGWLA